MIIGNRSMPTQVPGSLFSVSQCIQYDTLFLFFSLAFCFEHSNIGCDIIYNICSQTFSGCDWHINLDAVAPSLLLHLHFFLVPVAKLIQIQLDHTFY